MTMTIGPAKPDVAIGVSKRIRPARIALRLIGGTIIEGTINLGNKDRMSEVFIDGDSDFVVVFDAILNGEECKTLVVNKATVLWVEPLEAGPEQPSRTFQKGFADPR